MNPFFIDLFSEMKKIDFKNKQAAFVGLGDKRYEPVLFCEGIEDVNRLWVKNGGEKIGKTLLIQGEPYEQLDSIVDSWSNQIAEAFS